MWDFNKHIPFLVTHFMWDFTKRITGCGVVYALSSVLFTLDLGVLVQFRCRMLFEL